MTTELRAALLAVLLLASGCAALHENREGDNVDVSSYPPDVQRAYEVFALRCSRCHTLARPLNARITDPQHWIRYVTRMRRQPGSGIDHNNADLILKFLLYYHRPNVAQSVEPVPPSEPIAPEPADVNPPVAAPPPAPEPALPAPPAPAPPALPPDGLDHESSTPSGVPDGGQP